MTTKHMRADTRGNITRVFQTHPRHTLTLNEITVLINTSSPVGSFRFGQGAVRAALDRMQDDGLIALGTDPEVGASVFTWLGAVPEKWYVMCTNCGEVWDNLEIAKDHESDFRDDESGCLTPTYEIQPESEAF